jgi:FAD synthetase
MFSRRFYSNVIWRFLHNCLQGNPLKSCNLMELVSKYVGSAEHVLDSIKLVENPPSLDAKNIRKVVEAAKSYLKDAKYYRDQKKFEVSLASVAYCEGLLDALKLLGAVKFEWPTKKKEGKREK